MNLESLHNYNILKNISLSNYTSIRIGGKADHLLIAHNQNLFIEVFNYCLNHNIRFLPIGNGTNIFFSDNGFRGLVAIIKFDKIRKSSDTIVVAEAGVPLSKLNKICIDNSLTGFEFTAGIPGTVGGAIFGNTGAYEDSVGNYLTKAKILTANGEVKFVDNDYFEFAYRNSKLKNSRDIILEAEFQFKKGNPKEIKRKVKEILDQRRIKLPNSNTLTAGSYFKNIRDESGNLTAAAVYLDAVGSKRTSVGDAGIYQKHANIFINKGHATAKDILELENILKERVLKKFGIKLEREVIYIE
jgi:UDP-N-acetylmuramate dehydrogenase